MTDAEILDQMVRRLPENTWQALALRLGESRQTVHNWTLRGIAWQARHKVAELALKVGVSIPADFLKAKRPPTKRAA